MRKLVDYPKKLITRESCNATGDNKEMKKCIVIAAILAFAMLLPPFVPRVCAQSGPRTENLSVSFYSCKELAYTALEAGEVDMTVWPLTPSMFADATTNPEIVLARYIGNDMYGYGFNLNQTIPVQAYRGIVSPMVYLDFRQALAYLVDKDYWISILWGELAKRIDVPVPYSQSTWWNQSVTGQNYPWEFNTNNAKAILDVNFTQGSTVNEYYLPVSWSAQYIRTYPPDHPQKAGQDLDPIRFAYEWGNQKFQEMARFLIDNMRIAGIPVTEMSYSGDTILNQDFHICIGGDIRWKEPLTLRNNLFKLLRGVCNWFHSLRPPSYTGSRELDMLRAGLDGWQTGMVVKWIEESDKCITSSSFSESVAHNKKAQGAYVEGVFGIPLWSSYTWQAYRNDVLGVVSMPGVGILNQYTLLNARRVGGGPLRIGLSGAPHQLNIAESHWVNDYSVLGLVFADAMGLAPYNLASNQPWYIQDWDTNSWTHPESGQPATMMDLWFRKGVYAAKPVGEATCDQGPELTAYDYEFSAYFFYAQNSEGETYATHSNRFRHLYNITVLDKYHAKVFFNTTVDVWAPNLPTFPILPMEAWLNNTGDHPVCQQNENDVLFNVPENVELPGTLSTSHYVVSGSVPEHPNTTVWARCGAWPWEMLEWGRDYEWRRGKLYVKIARLHGKLIDQVRISEYWYLGNLGGFYPGPWNSGDEAIFDKHLLMGYGPYYIWKVVPGVGGYASLKRNKYFMMETPLLGEVDWVWKWGAGPKPRSGHYKVDIFDLVLAGGAWGSQGTSYPSVNWLPGADLATAGGVIDIFDLVTITGVNWDQEFGHPP